MMKRQIELERKQAHGLSRIEVTIEEEDRSAQRARRPMHVMEATLNN
jgi:hypothetical protein